MGKGWIIYIGGAAPQKEWRGGSGEVGDKLVVQVFSGVITGERYQYIGQPCSSGGQQALPQKLAKVVTPLKLCRWEEALRAHPDQAFAKYILRGIEGGFRIGFNDKCCHLKARPSNMPSAEEHPEVVDNYIREEVASERLVEMTGSEAERLGIHTSPFGVIPKKNKPNKWRLILDLSSPTGQSVNNGVGKELASLSHVSVDDVVNRVQQLGKGAMMAKMDVKQAYQNIPVHPLDRHLLGMNWAGKTYVDTTLPFGLRSAAPPPPPPPFSCSA